MAIFNLTNLFNTTPINNIAQTGQVRFKGNELKVLKNGTSSEVGDSYVSNPLLKETLDINRLNIAMNSPNVQNFLKANNLKAKLNEKAIPDIANHSTDAKNLAVRIALNMG